MTFTQRNGFQGHSRLLCVCVLTRVSHVCQRITLSVTFRNTINILLRQPLSLCLSLAVRPARAGGQQAPGILLSLPL